MSLHDGPFVFSAAFQRTISPNTKKKVAINVLSLERLQEANKSSFAHKLPNVSHIYAEDDPQRLPED